MAVGDIDPDFGVGGFVSDPGQGRVDVNDVEILAGDKILIAGAAFPADPEADPDYLLRRYNADGSIDTTFGTGGSVTGEFTADTAAVIHQIELAAGGKIV